MSTTLPISPIELAARMRRRDVKITAAALADFGPADAREQAAIACNLELVLR